MSKPISPSDYRTFLAALKNRILHARTTAARAVNQELVRLYWDIGRGILEKQRLAGWGDAVVERLAADLRSEFSDAGFRLTTSGASASSTLNIRILRFWNKLFQKSVNRWGGFWNRLFQKASGWNPGPGGPRFPKGSLESQPSRLRPLKGRKILCNWCVNSSPVFRGAITLS